MSQTPNEALPTANGLYVGEIRLLPFRHDALPSGWYFCNGERFLLTSPQGGVLSSLSDDFLTDWGMVEDLCSISLPNLFSEDGRGCFFRPVDGVKRQVGVVEGDAIRNIKGDCTLVAADYIPGTNVIARGCIQQLERTNTLNIKYSTSGSCDHFAFDASKVVPTAEENRPINVGMTPAIYLGV